MAEEEGFEPSESCPSAVFKTAALNHSTILPHLLRIYKISPFREFYNPKNQIICKFFGCFMEFLPQAPRFLIHF